MKIRHRLTIGNIVTLVLFMSLVPVTVFLVHRMQSDSRQLAEVEEPLEQAVLEMEINVGETARWVLHFALDPDPRSLDAIIDSEGDFERYAKQFERLAETEEERALGREVIKNYREFKSLGDEITFLAQRRLNDLRLFRKDAETIGALIDDKLQIAIDRSSSEAVTKLEAALDMEININEAIFAIEGNVLDPSPVLKRKVADAEADFKRFEAQYRGTRLSEEESQFLDEISSVFAKAITAGVAIAALTDEIREKLDQLERRLEEIDRILDDEIQTLLLKETQRAARNVEMSGQIAIAVVIVAGLIILLTTIALNWRVSKAIVGGVGRLSEGATEFARGNLEHRIGVRAKDELGELADHFNKMAERQKSDAAALRAGAENLRTTLDCIDDAVISADSSGNIVLMNPVAEALTGWSLGETIGLPISDVFHIINGKTGEPAINPVESVLEYGKAVGLANDTMLVARDGMTYQIADAASPIRDGEGNISGVVIVFRDVTEDYAVRTALEESEQRLRSAFDHSTVGTVVIDEDGIIASYNRAAQIMFGYLASEVIGRNVKMLMPEPYRSDHDTYIQNYKDSGIPKILGIGREVVGRRKNGAEFPLHLGIGEMIVGDSRSFIGSITDLTEFKILEQKLFQAQRMEAVGQLTGGIAHDFNNILAVLAGNTELLELKIGGDEALRRQLEAITRAVGRAAALTDRLLAFSRQKTLLPVPTNIADLVSGLEDTLQRTLGETVHLKIQTNRDLWLAAIDSHQFENALVNLAINARDAIPAGGSLTIEASNVTLDETYAKQYEDLIPGDFVMVAVSDTGAGMSSGVLERAFEPFFTTKGVGEGSGLGLSMVYGFVKQSAGHITINSEAGRGTTVKLYMPRAGVESDEVEITDHAGAVLRGSECILVVEDDPNVREVSVSILRDHGYDVSEAANGEEAVDRLKTGTHFDLLFTDVVLPGGMNGVEIAEAAKGLAPDIKIIYTTGYAETTVFSDGALDSGVTLVNKPFRRSDLLRQVRDLLDSKDA